MAWKPAYTTVDELRTYVRISDHDDDVQLGYAIESASRAIERAVNRQFGIVAAPELRKYKARFDQPRQRVVIDIDDLMTQSGLVVAVSVGAVSDLELEPINAAQNGEPWTLIVVGPTSANTPVADEWVSVTASWGWTAVPETIKQATLLQASRFFSRRTSPYGVAGSPEMGNELRLLSKVDADVAVMIGSYTRWWSAV